MFGELLVLAGDYYKGWLIAEESAVVLELGLSSLNDLLEDSSFRKLFFSRISERVAKMTERIEILSYKKVSDRIILYLLNHYDDGREYEMNITSLAAELECSREALSRALSTLANDGAIEKQGRLIRILSRPILETGLSFI